MNYTLHQLQILVEVVRLKSITKAAAELHMTQPALSIQLKKFQSQFHHTLIEIIGKKVHVTELGQSIAEKAVELLTIANEINYLSNEYEGLHRGKLRIISVSTGKYVIPYFISDFLHLHPGIDINLDVSNKTDVVRSLKNNEVDFALVSISPPGLKINEEPLLENKLYLVGKNKKYDMNEPIIYREKGSSTRNLMNDYFSKGKSRKRIELTSNEAVKQAVIAGLGYSIMPLVGMKNELINKQLHIIPSKSLPIKNNWRLIWLTDKLLSPVADAFLTHLKNQKTNIIKNYFQWYINFNPTSKK